MPQQLIKEQISQARTILELHPLPPAHLENVLTQLCDLELHLQAHEQADYQRMADLLREAETELEVDHPVVASVLGSLVQTLANIGV